MLAGALASLAGCGLPEVTGYQFVCGTADACPEGTSCSGGCCVRPAEPPRCRGRFGVGPVGAPCLSNADCSTGTCAQHLCVAVSCTDGLKNGPETDVDCGGACPACGAGKSCSSGADCSSRRCTSGRCQAPSCSDGLQNGDEKGVDCGGSCKAELFVYFCPQYAAEGCCGTEVVNINGTCLGTVPTLGVWLDAKMTVLPHTTYVTYDCPTCGSCSACSATANSFSTPMTFDGCKYCAYSQGCTNRCTAPACPP